MKLYRGQTDEENHVKTRLHLTLVDGKSLLMFNLEAEMMGKSDLFVLFWNVLNNYYKYKLKSLATT